MPNTKSAAKAMRQTRRRTARNIITKNKFRTAIKDVKKEVATSNKTEAAKKLSLAMAALDKAAKKGVIHKNTASRKKSRLALAINKLQ